MRYFEIPTVASAPEKIVDLLRAMLEKGASDLHLAVGSPPMIRVDGKLEPFNTNFITPESIKEMAYSILDSAQQQKFEEDKGLDFSYSIPGLSRFRANYLMQRGTIGCVFRAIPQNPPSLNKLGFSHLMEFCNKPRGLVLVTGPTSSGKTTTLAAMIDYINDSKSLHIVTIEDPIEFIFHNKRSVIRQRELGSDVPSFPAALKQVLRQDPDVILVGEMRDLETIALAITAAETGHLVLATLHTSGAAKTVDRIVDVFPNGQQEQIRTQLSAVLEGVISQELLAKADGPGRVCAMEIMTVTPGIRNLIREGKTQQIQGNIQTGGQLGMRSLEMALKELVMKGTVKYEEALSKAGSADDFVRLMGRVPVMA